MGIELPFGMTLWPMLIGGIVTGILVDSWAYNNGHGNNPIIAIPVVAGAIGCGKVGGWIADGGWRTVVFAFWCAIFFGALVFIVVYACKTHAKFGNVQRQTTNMLPQVMRSKPALCISKNRQPVMYHATPDISNAYDIYRFCRFKVGPSTPLGHYVSPDFDLVSSQYGKGTGAVVEYYINPNVPLMEKGQGTGFFYFNTPNSIVGQYINLPDGMVPVKIWDCMGNQLNT